jgi:hypothetical protein
MADSDFPLIEFLNRDKSELPLDEYEPRTWNDKEMYERCKRYLLRETEPPKQINRIEIEDGGFRIYCSYDEQFIAALKAIVPYRERIWENSTKTWFVSNMEHLEQVETVFNMLYEWTFEELEVIE